MAELTQEITTFLRSVAAPTKPGETSTAVAERLMQLTELTLFRGIKLEALLPLAQSSETLMFDIGEYIVRQGDPGDSVYVVVDGRVEVMARIDRDGIATESVVASLTDGDALGELSILDGQPRSASCVAAVPTRCVRLSRNDLRHAMMTHFELADAMLTTLAERLRRADSVLAEHARDPLTGVYNRRALYEIYGRESRRAQRVALRAAGITHEQISTLGDEAVQEAISRFNHRQELANTDLPPPLAVLFVDVNKFKTINDTYGHKTGDDVLCAVARSLTRCARATDHVARYGGDEFVMIMPEAGTIGAQTVSDRVRSYLSDTPPGPVPFSISIGAAVIDRLQPPTLDEVMAHADEEMYRDKARQR